MSVILRVTGAWTGLAMDWLQQQDVDAPELMKTLVQCRTLETVPLPLWRHILFECVGLSRGSIAPELDIGAFVQPEHVGKLGYLILASETLGDAMLAYQRYESVFYGVNLVKLDVRDQQVNIRWPQSEKGPGPIADGVAISALVTFIKRQLSDSPSPSQIAFCGTASFAKQKAYEVFFQCPVLFDQPEVSVHFPLSVLQRVMPQRDPALRSLLDRQIQALVRALPSITGFESRLQQALLKLFIEGEPTLQRAAHAMNMSSRTLQRRLQAHELTWQQWLDVSREQLAMDYLSNLSLSLSDIALLLGFSEQSAFTRAYRRWTGHSPGQVRRAFKIH